MNLGSGPLLAQPARIRITHKPASRYIIEAALFRLKGKISYVPTPCPVKEAHKSISENFVIQIGDPSDTILLRAERSGNGDGRVYEVSFTASDGFESCDDTVQVSVPHSRKSTAVDDGQAYDSTTP